MKGLPMTLTPEAIGLQEDAKAAYEQGLHEDDAPQQELDATQLEAIRRCCDISPSNRTVPITGQAGTGKTTIMKQVYDKLVEAGYRVAMAAPTGKAAKRIQEATGIPAMTAHRLLEYPHPGERDEKTGKQLRTTEPKRNRHNPLLFDILLVDEYAMIKWEVHRNLVDALPKGGCIRMFGDVNQLQPIESNKRLQDAPSPFQDAIHTFNGVVLTTIHRQSDGSGIVANGARILAGRVPQRTDDFTLKVTNQPINELREFVYDKPQYKGLDAQVISPAVGTWVGTMKVNQMMQDLFIDPDAEYVPAERHKWITSKHKITELRVFIGDKVIWTENNYDLEVFNGETGIVVDVSPELGSITIDFGDRVVDVPILLVYTDKNGREAQYNPQRSIELAYCVTTHKAQGSEFKEVVYLINKSSAYNQNRRNFYTGITRASQQVHLITDQKSLNLSVFKKG